MRIYESTQVLGDVFHREKLLEDCRVVRISPRSYYAGEKSGFTLGIGVGIVLGIMLACCWAATRTGMQ